MNIYEILESLEREVAESRPLPWPMQEKCVVNREKLLRILEQTRETIPQEVKHARWVTRETERIAQECSSRADRVLREAESRSREMLRSASQEVERLASREGIAVQAKTHAETLLAQAREEAARLKAEAERYSQQVRSEADRYASHILCGLEDQYLQLLQAVKKAKDTLKPRPDEF